MSGRPEILREYRAKIAPASEVEPVGIEERVGMICVWFCFDCLEPLETMDCY
jgi:hypothetical protein